MDGQKANDGPKTTSASRSRRWPWVVGGVLILVALLLLLAPVFLSSHGFTRMVVARINRSTGGTAEMGDLSVGWRKGIRISDFSFRDGSGWTAIRVRKIAAQPQLTSFLGGSLTLGRTVIDQPNIEIDLRRRPIQPSTPRANSPETPSRAAAFAVTSDIVVNDASVRLTGTTGKTVEITQLNSKLNVRPPGQPSSVHADMVVADAGEPAQIRLAGTVKPAKQTGWTLKGTTGDVTVEIRDLNLEQLAPVFELARLELETAGNVSATITGTMLDGQLEQATATIQGEDLNIAGEFLNGDRLQSSQLNVTAEMARDGEVIGVTGLDVRTDWATLTASGRVPASPKPLGDMLKTGSDYDFTGTFDADLAALLSQMPNTFAMKEGMHVDAGRATGSIRAVTKDGRGTLVTQADVVGLAGKVDGKDLALSEPVKATFKLSADEKRTELETLEVTSAFATVRAGGDFEQIRYEGHVDLAKLQSELGQFANLGPYQMAGDVSSTGSVSIREDRTAVVGSASVRQFALASIDGNSVSEPAATVDFSLSVDDEKQVLAVDELRAKTSLGNIDVNNGAIPLDRASATPMKLDIMARDLDLKKLKPYAVLFASFPKHMELGGIAQSKLVVAGQENRYRVQTDATNIENFKLVAPGKEPFAQEYVTTVFDVLVDPNERAFAVEKLELEGPQITIKKGEFKKTTQAERANIQAALQAQCDWSAVGQATSAFLPDGLQLAGRREVSLNLASTYPANEPNQMLAHLAGAASTGFDRAHYMGLGFGPTDIDVRIEQGAMIITPFSTTVNNGQLSFAAQADFKKAPTLLKTSGPLQLARNIEINKEMTAKLLKYVNPIFANVVSISGVASFDCQELAIPLEAGQKKAVNIVGTLTADHLYVEASNVLNQILAAFGESLRGQPLTLHPTRIVVRDGMVRYDNMQIDVGDNPISFGGAIGLDGRLDMTVTLPWTYRGRTERVGREGQAGTRISVPLRGTIDKPELDVSRLLQNQLLKGLEELLR